MRRVSVLAFAIGLVALCGTTKADEEADKKALKELEGNYLLVGLESKGFKLTEEDINKNIKEDERKIVIKGDQIIATSGGKEDPATIKLDASKKPPQIDITSTKDGKTETNYGIYKLENGVLTICATEKGEAKDRPKEFKADDKSLMIVLKKQK